MFVWGGAGLSSLVELSLGALGAVLFCLGLTGGGGVDVVGGVEGACSGGVIFFSAGGLFILIIGGVCWSGSLRASMTCRRAFLRSSWMRDIMVLKASSVAL